MNKTTIGYITIIVLLVLTSAFSLNLFLRQRTDHDNLDIRTFPHTVGAWEGEDLEIQEYEYKILETRNLISRRYTNSAGEKLYLFIIYSETNRSVFHPPEVCFIGSGVTVNDKQTEYITSLGKSGFSTNKLYLEKNGSRQIALYSYKVGDFYTDNFYIQQTHFALNQLFGKKRGGATIRVSMSIGETEEQTIASLKGFMKEVVVLLADFT